MRRLRNTKFELGPEVRKLHLDKFMLKLKNSGYNTKFRKEILDSGLKAYNKMLDDDKSGTKTMYRSKEWNQDARNDLKSRKKVNWWNSDNSKVQYKSVLFVTPTPGGSLQKSSRREKKS